MYNYKGLDQPKKTLICSAIKNADYDVAFSYINPHIIKTNAPFEILLEIKNDYVKYKTDVMYNGKSNFSNNDDIRKMRKRYPVRFMPNPAKFWGPKRAASIKYQQVDAAREKVQLPKVSLIGRITKIFKVFKIIK